MGAAGTATVDFGTGVGVTRDATKKWWFPATNKEWTRLLKGSGIPNPRLIWLCQDASGNLAEVNGLAPAAPSGAAATYLSPTTGFSRFGVKAAADNTTCFFGAVPLNQEINNGRPIFLLTVRHFNTLSAGGTILGGAQGVTSYTIGLSASGPGSVFANWSGAGAVTSLTVPSVDTILGMLINPNAPTARERFSVLMDSIKDELNPVGVGTSALSGTPSLNLLGDGTAAGSDATLLYAAAWCGPPVVNSPITRAQAQQVIRLMKNGPRYPFPGTNRTTMTVTGQAGITPTSHVEAWIQGTDSTADHNAYEHSMVPVVVRPENIVNAVGFDITCTSELRLTGTWKVHWVWN
jgi:hypothetical protein